MKLIEEGLALYNTRRNPECRAAILKFTEVLGEDCDPALKAQALARRGIAHHTLHEEPEAFADFAEAITLDPHCARAYNSRGMIKQQAGDIEGAIEDYQAAIHAVPEYAPPSLNLGTILYDQERFAEALTPLSDAIALNPNLELAYKTRASCYKHTGDTEWEIADYSAILRISPHDMDTYLARANAYGLSHYRDAIADFNTVIASPHATKEQQGLAVKQGKLLERRKSISELASAPWADRVPAPDSAIRRDRGYSMGSSGGGSAAASGGTGFGRGGGK